MRKEHTEYNGAGSPGLEMKLPVAGMLMNRVTWLLGPAEVYKEKSF